MATTKPTTESNPTKPKQNKTRKFHNHTDDESNGTEPNNNEKHVEHDTSSSPKDIVFNYSDIELTESMKSLLNLGLNYSIIPLKLDLTQVLVDFNKFERSVIWQEFWHGREKDENYKVPIFKSQKNNLPKNHKIPKGLKTFINSVKSEILDPKNRNCAECNLTPDKMAALKELTRLQCERIITIKACDKGAGIIILNFKDYMSACYMHLLSKLERKGEISQYYYKEVSAIFLAQAKIEIISVLEDALEKQLITYGEFQAMNFVWTQTQHGFIVISRFTRNTYLVKRRQ